MFGKNTEQGTNPKSPGAGTELAPDAERRNAIIESMMAFTGAQSVEELEQIVKGAESNAAADKASEDEMLFGAVSSIKDNRSILEAKEMEKNEDFVSAVLAGFDAEKAYMLANCERLIREAYEEGEKQGKAQAEVKYDRINEEGINVTGGYKAEIDPGNMTMEELKKIKERLRKGENIRI